MQLLWMAMVAEGREMAMEDQTEMMTNREAARFLGFAPATLKKRRMQGDPPSYFKIGKAVRYRRDDLERYLNECRVTAGDDHE